MLFRIFFIFQLLLLPSTLMAQDNYINEYIKKDSIVYDSIIIIRQAPIIINKKVYIFEKEKSQNKFLSLEAGPVFPLQNSYHKGYTIVEPSSSFSFLVNGGFFTKKLRFDLGIGFSETRNKITATTKEITGITQSQYATIENVKAGYSIYPDTAYYYYQKDTVWHTRQDTSFVLHTNSTFHTSKTIQVPASVSIPIRLKKIILTIGAGATLNINVSNSFSNNPELFVQYLPKKLSMSPFATIKILYPLYHRWYLVTGLNFSTLKYRTFKPYMPNAAVHGGIHYFF